jgi:hypothetical protein
MTGSAVLDLIIVGLVAFALLELWWLKKRKPRP